MSAKYLHIWPVSLRFTFRVGLLRNEPENAKMEKNEAI